ncbi:unnamed protein product [Rotaria sp. Silwood2]|nr:unnamed protein product [Rotaria sp. Silwood2]CAF4438738.1 unnamed protein product [Rotaria sp. Silwood2]
MWKFIFISLTTLAVINVSAVRSSLMNIGCYADFNLGSPVMNDAVTNISSNTPEKCASYCTSLSIAYSGTENGNECYCSEVPPTVKSDFCTTPCAGDSKQICGGVNALSIAFTTIPSLPATNSTKRGLCWSWNNNVSTFAFFSPSSIPWLYNWELWDPRPVGIYSTAEYIPMCRTAANAPKILNHLSKCNAKRLLGFNEPDLPEAKGGYYISPYDTSVLWKNYIEPMKTRCNMTLGAPAITSSTTPGMGIDWLQQFFGNCTASECSFDFLPIHWYGKSLKNFQKHVTKVNELFPNYPLWITEWQFTGFSVVATTNLIKQAIQWLDAQNYVERYAMFAPKEAARMNSMPNAAMITDDLSGLTNAGKIYAGLL